MGCEVVVGGASDGDAKAVERLFETLEAALEPLPADLRPRAPQRLARPDGDRLPAPRGRYRRRAARRGCDRWRLRSDDRRRARRSGLRPQLREHRGAVRRCARPRRPLARDHALGAPRPSPARATARPQRRRQGPRRRRCARARSRATGFVSAGGDLATRGELVVALPGEGTVTLRSGALATSGVRVAPGCEPTASRRTTSSIPRPALPLPARGSASPSAPRPASPPTSPRKPHSSSGTTGLAGSSGAGSPAGSSAAQDEIVLAGRLARERGGRGVHVIASSTAVWYAARAGGVVAYLLVSASVLAGSARRQAARPRLPTLRRRGRAPLPRPPRRALHRDPRRLDRARHGRAVLA